MRFPTLQNAKNILTSGSRGIVHGFLFLPTCPPRQRFLYRRTEKKKPTHRAGLDIPASIYLASLAEKGIKRKEKWGYGFRLSRPLAAYKGMASPSRYRAAGTCVPCSATCTWYASFIGAEGAIPVLRTRKPLLVAIRPMSFHWLTR